MRRNIGFALVLGLGSLAAGTGCYTKSGGDGDLKGSSDSAGIKSAKNTISTISSRFNELAELVKVSKEKLDKRKDELDAAVKDLKDPKTQAISAADSKSFHAARKLFDDPKAKNVNFTELDKDIAELERLLGEAKTERDKVGSDHKEINELIGGLEQKLSDAKQHRKDIESADNAIKAIGTKLDSLVSDVDAEIAAIDENAEVKGLEDLKSKTSGVDSIKAFEEIYQAKKGAIDVKASTISTELTALEATIIGAGSVQEKADGQVKAIAPNITALATDLVKAATALDRQLGTGTKYVDQAAAGKTKALAEKAKAAKAALAKELSPGVTVDSILTKVEAAIDAATDTAGVEAAFDGLVPLVDAAKITAFKKVATDKDKVKTTSLKSIVKILDMVNLYLSTPLLTAFNPGGSEDDFHTALASASFKDLLTPAVFNPIDLEVKSLVETRVNALVAEVKKKTDLVDAQITKWKNVKSTADYATECKALNTLFGTDVIPNTNCKPGRSKSLVTRKSQIDDNVKSYRDALKAVSDAKTQEEFDAHIGALNALFNPAINLTPADTTKYDVSKLIAIAKQHLENDVIDAKKLDEVLSEFNSAVNAADTLAKIVALDATNLAKFLAADVVKKITDKRETAKNGILMGIKGAAKGVGALKDLKDAVVAVKNPTALKAGAYKGQIATLSGFLTNPSTLLTDLTDAAAKKGVTTDAGAKAANIKKEIEEGDVHKALVELQAITDVKFAVISKLEADFKKLPEDLRLAVFGDKVDSPITIDFKAIKVKLGNAYTSLISDAKGAGKTKTESNTAPIVGRFNLAFAEPIEELLKFNYHPTSGDWKANEAKIIELAGMMKPYADKFKGFTTLVGDKLFEADGTTRSASDVRPEIEQVLKLKQGTGNEGLKQLVTSTGSTGFSGELKAAINDVYGYLTEFF